MYAAMQSVGIVFPEIVVTFAPPTNHVPVRKPVSRPMSATIVLNAKPAFMSGIFTALRLQIENPKSVDLIVVKESKLRVCSLI